MMAVIAAVFRRTSDWRRVLTEAALASGILFTASLFPGDLS